jgi:hypothetical protein
MDTALYRANIPEATGPVDANQVSGQNKVHVVILNEEICKYVWGLANHTQIDIWGGLKTFFKTEFGTSHKYDGHIFKLDAAQYRYALLARKDGSTAHMIHSGGRNQYWREITDAPRDKKVTELKDDNEFADIRMKHGLTDNPGWFNTSIIDLKVTPTVAQYVASG